MARPPNTKQKGKNGIVKGLCESCKKRNGVARVIAYHCGIPILCDACFSKRKLRTWLNYQAYKRKRWDGVTPWKPLSTQIDEFLFKQINDALTNQ